MMAVALSSDRWLSDGGDEGNCSAPGAGDRTADPTGPGRR